MSSLTWARAQWLALLLTVPVLFWFACFLIGSGLLQFPIWAPPLQTQSIVDSYSASERLEYIHVVIVWGFVNVAWAYLSGRIIASMALRGFGYFLGAISNDFKMAMIDWNKEKEKAEKHDGPSEVRLARRRLAIYREHPEAIHRMWRISPWRLFGKSEEWYNDHLLSRLQDTIERWDSL